jgi:hypothetical protein
MKRMKGFEPSTFAMAMLDAVITWSNDPEAADRANGFRMAPKRAIRRIGLSFETPIAHLCIGSVWTSRGSARRWLATVRTVADEVPWIGRGGVRH